MGSGWVDPIRSCRGDLTDESRTSADAENKALFDSLASSKIHKESVLKVAEV